MSLTVWKFPLGEGDNDVEIPSGGAIVHVNWATEGPALFVIVDPDAEKVTRSFFVAVNQGVELPEGISAIHYRGTAKIPGGGPAAHVFETTEVTATV